MKVILHFDSAQEFAHFICSTAGFVGGKSYTFISQLTEVHIGEVTYAVTEGWAKLEPMEYKVVNYMINDEQKEWDNTWIKKDGEEQKGSQAVREVMEKLPQNFILETGWRTDYLTYVFRRQ